MTKQKDDMGKLIPFGPVEQKEKAITSEKDYSFEELIEENRRKQRREAEERAKSNQKVIKGYRLIK